MSIYALPVSGLLWEAKGTEVVKHAGGVTPL